MYQQVTIVGNLGKDPELRYLPSGAAVCSFSVATSERWTDRQTNEKKEKTVWWRVSVFGQQAEVCSQYLAKGRQVMVIGTAEARAYLDNASQPQASLELRARDVRFLGSRNDAAGGGSYGGDNDFAPPPDNMSDIPF